MPTNFSWQTDEEDWEKLPETTAPAPRKRRERWGRLLLLLIVLSAAGVVYWQITQRVDEATTSVAADLNASFEIIQRAQALEDLELFRSVLSGREPEWTQAQRDLFSAGLFYDRPGLGLHWQGLDEDADQDIQLDDDLNAASLITIHQYETVNAEGVTETVQLALTELFRTGSNRWLLAPPLTEFWGKWQSSEYEYVQFNYPGRDAELARRLGDDLDPILSNLCAQLPESACATDDPLTVRFSKSPASLLATRESSVHFENEDETINLPAPTLVGYPVNDTAYDALLRGYARQLAAAAVPRWVAYECCQHGLYLEAIIDYLLAQADVSAWPVQATDYDQLLADDPTLQQANLAWQVRFSPENIGDVRTNVYMVLDFLLEGEPAATVTDLLRTLNGNLSFYDWLQTNVTNPNLGDLDQAWYAFLLSRSSASQQEQPVPWPEQDVLLSCFDNIEGQGTTIYRYRPDDRSLTEIDSFGGTGFAFPLPNDQGIIKEYIFPNEEIFEFQLHWLDDSVTTILPDPDLPPVMFFLGEMNPAGDRLIWIHPAETGNGQQFSSLDLNDCRGQDSCQTAMVDGFPTWSPDSTAALLQQSGTDGTNLWLGNSAGQQETLVASPAANPYWLSERRFGYLTPDGIAIASRDPEANSFEAEMNIERRDMLNHLDVDRTIGTQFFEVVTRPGIDDELYILAANLQFNDNYLIHHRLDSNESDIIHRGEGSWYNFSLSLTGRYLTLFERPAPTSSFSSAPRATVIDLAGGPTRRYLNSDVFFTNANWSPDDTWLVLPLGNALIFAVPGENYQTIQFMAFAERCFGAFWISRQG